MNRVAQLALTALPAIVLLGMLFMGRYLSAYLSSQMYLAGLVFLLVLLLCLWFYDRLYFPLLMIAFLWAGMRVPMSEAWTAGRWVVLGAGAFVGIMRTLGTSLKRYSAFHLAAFAAVSTALISAMASSAPQFSLLKALSLFLLFLYGAAGARVVLKNPDRFFRGLLLACEISMYGSVICYLLLGREIWGNRNSLGAVEGVIAAPLLLWGALIANDKTLRLRRGIACVGALFLVCFTITRAAMLASGLSILLLLVGLRRYRLIVQGAFGIACIVAVTAIVAPNRFDDTKESLVSGVIYKGHEEQGLLGSRLSPWQETVHTIQQNPYFGSGFGTSMSGDSPFGGGGRFASSSAVREHGSSYLAIAEYVGLLGIVPFVVLILLLAHAIIRVLLWVRRTGSACHYAVPLMLVLVAGLVHAGFEDWMFAVGYYLTILFWTFAFLMMDILPAPPVHDAPVVHRVPYPYQAGLAASRQ